MMRSLRLAMLGALALIPIGAAHPQESKQKSNEEDSRLAKLVEHWLQAHETERDRVAREVARAGGDAAAAADFGTWFTALGGGDNGWDRTQLRRKTLIEIFDR